MTLRDIFSLQDWKKVANVIQRSIISSLKEKVWILELISLNNLFVIYFLQCPGKSVAPNSSQQKSSSPPQISWFIWNEKKLSFLNIGDFINAANYYRQGSKLKSWLSAGFELVQNFGHRTAHANNSLQIHGHFRTTWRLSANNLQ